ncbi:MAG: DUF1059 domain-containing protein [Bacteroidia bacterium]|nr:DUF1059 domain-containing protein [Bacteroidia bacterium]NNL79199.1 DUF1059 domain-containing protein [Flavobacteriaceae bacterium]
MKTMTCKELGGACDQTFTAETFEEMVAMSKQHGMEMFEKGDTDHLNAMQEIRAMMQEPGAVEKWMEARKAKFDALADD